MSDLAADRYFGLAVASEVPQLPAPDREVKVFARIDPTQPSESIARQLEIAALEVRRRGIQSIAGAGLGHIGGEYSIIDVLVTLYMLSMNITPEMVETQDQNRDRLFLSKGHAANALYTVLAATGYINPQALRTFMQAESMLNGHPAQNKINAVEANTGPLGHGLPIAVGSALAAQLDGSPRKTFVLLGDGEMQEGSNWEAMMFAGNRRLGNLMALVDRNLLQQGATVEETNDLEPLIGKLEAFNWKVVEVDGHDHLALAKIFADLPDASGKPTFVVAHTQKGYPISFMKNNVAWHHKVPNSDQVTQAIAELDARLKELLEEESK